MKLVYEVNGSDVVELIGRQVPQDAISGFRLILNLAESKANKHGVRLSDVTLRFVEG